MESKADGEPASLKEEGKPEDSVQVTSGKTAQVLVSEEDSLSINDFHNNDNKVLELLNEAGSKYSFKGLMRKLNLHQQSLSRALRRLEELGLVEKTAEGYRLGKLADSIGLRPTPKGTDYMQL
ncbi:MAG TPA: MarR family transcriptional regulator, partial [Nitrososphaera sp.]|nr:MarR family transcriptional regulator [Nitrososphaera sp.]